jgi:hypothetical protein
VVIGDAHAQRVGPSLSEVALASCRTGTISSVSWYTAVALRITS